jgi:hypothetical protein
LVDILYLLNSGCFDKTGVFQQPRAITLTIRARLNRSLPLDAGGQNASFFAHKQANLQVEKAGP